MAIGAQGLKDVEKVLRFDKDVLRWRIFRHANPAFDVKAIKMRHFVRDGNLVEALKDLKAAQS